MVEIFLISKLRDSSNLAILQREQMEIFIEKRIFEIYFNQLKMNKLILSILILTSTYAFSQPYQGSEKPKTKPTIGINKAAACTPPTTTTYLNLNNVSAMVHTGGNLWQVPAQNNSHYEVPKNSGTMALFTAALWLGGEDVNGQLKIAAVRYREGQDYWTGPLSNLTANTDYDNCAKYDKHFISTYDQISEFHAWHEAGLNDDADGTSTQADQFPGYTVPDIIKKWPAHGDVSLGQDYYLAPFMDVDNDGVYQYENGDYPWYDLDKSKQCKSDRRVSLYGDINYWWVMNDKGNIHTETQGEPIGMEIRAQSFAFSSNDEINNMTFYNYELINRGTQTLYNTYFGFFTDGALGNPTDDFVGCDVNRGLGYYYNGNNFDADAPGGYKGYGNSPPAVGVDFFEGPFQDDDGIDNAFGIGTNEALNGIGYGDGVIDNERFGMRRFLYYSNTTNGANPNQTDPINATDYYNYLQGKWKDGSEFYYGGNGYISDPDADPNVPCDFMFPGDTDPLGWGTNGTPQEPWTEQSAGNIPNDKRFVQSAGPFVLKPGSVNNITVGVCWARSSGIDPFESVKTLRIADDKAQALFENCFRILEGPHSPNLEIQELENELILMLSNPANSNNYNEQYEEIDPLIVSTIPNVDKKYRFQGYLIYQLKNDAVAISELEDNQKARLVAQCDVKDGLSKIINYEFDDYLQASVPKLKVDGANTGIKHSFQITNDLFALGNAKLVNFKEYHFLAVSYATNNYKTYIQDDPQANDGQKKIFLLSRKAAIGSVKTITAIPHNPMPEANGTAQLIGYGSTPRITRLEGYGNGNRALELTKESEEYIVENGFMENPTYEYGSGPINIKVVDPLNVADGYFECEFDDNGYDNTLSNGADKANWTINRYDKKGGTLLESVQSQVDISQNNEQIIPKWGVSVEINQVKYSGTSVTLYSEPINSSIQFADSSKKWLGAIADNDGFNAMNWIRAGSSNDPSTDGTPSYNAPSCYKDELNVDNEKLYTKLLGGGIAPHILTGYQCDYQPLAYYGVTAPSVPGSIKKYAQIAYLPSVNIVLTADKSKWTRCPVFELGRDPNLTIGAAKAGGLRKSKSLDINLKEEETGTGMSWFPGYAIDLESGARLFMAFGENSFLTSDNGGDMKWNPTDRIFDSQGTPVMGGQHPVYVYSYKQAILNDNTNPVSYDFPAYSKLNNHIYDLMQIIEGSDASAASSAKRKLYTSLTWIANPILNTGRSLLETDVTIKLRVNKEYKKFVVSGENNGHPKYSWNMDEFGTRTSDNLKLVEALDMINVVPNPYYAYSEYERNRLDTKVKITNLPEKCTVSIYSVNGKLMRYFVKDSPQTFLDWDLNNHKSIPVAGGIYLIHIEIPDVGERVLKFFGGMRQVDLQNL